MPGSRQINRGERWQPTSAIVAIVQAAHLAIYPPLRANLCDELGLGYLYAIVFTVQLIT